MKRRSTGFILQVLNSELDGGIVVSRGYVQTQPFWYLNAANVERVALASLKRVLRNLATNYEYPQVEEEVSLNGYQLFTTPNLGALLAYAVKTFRIP